MIAKLFSFLALLVAVAHGRISQQEIDALSKTFVDAVRPYKAEMLDWAMTLISDGPSSRAEYLTCDVCHPALLVARPLLEMGGTEEELTLAVAKVCELFDLGPADDICYPTIKGYVVPLAYMILNNPTLSNDDFCGFINDNCGTINSTFTSWETEVSNGKPEAEERPELPERVKLTKILQFTDLHLDLDYAIGMTTECVYPICCMVNNGLPAPGVTPAGPYGHPSCGLPYTAMAELFRYAREQHSDAKYIFLTGDYIHSGVWLYGEDYENGTIGENRRTIENLTNTLREYFPTTTVIPMTGNHETPIVNMYPPPAIQDIFPLKWMYNAVSGPFEDYMGGPGQVGSFKHGGFYTVSPQPGLRFVILNTNLCYIQNFWLPHDPIDPIGQLKWFSKTMAKAEAAHEQVYLLSHIPPGSGSCWTHWSDQYGRIVDRYAHIIQFQVHGHTHNEFYTVTFDRDMSLGERPVSVSFMGPSAVADHGGVGFKVYYVDGERKEDSTWELIDHETWMMNSSQSNMDGVPVWYQLYSASRDFGLRAHRPQDYYDLTLRMVGDTELFEKFKSRVYYKDNVNHVAPCVNVDCINNVICDTVNHNSADRTVCNKLMPRIRDNFNAGVTLLPLSSLATMSTIVAVMASIVL